MRTSTQRPCAEWAEQLAALHPTDLTTAERAARAAHLAACPACAAARAAYWRMDAEILRLPDPQPLIGLPPRLLRLWAEEDRHAGSRQPVVIPRVLEAFMQTTPNAGAPSPAPVPLRNERRTRWRLVSGITAIAAILIIGLITTALVASHTTSKGASTGNPVPAKPTPTPGNHGWVSIPALTNLPVYPLIAPSNPQVVYEANEPDQELAEFWRSDNGGATLTRLTLPNGLTPPADQALLAIDPTNAQHVFLVIDASLTNTPSYYSFDGGADWKLMHPPGGINVVGLNVIVQGERLYIIAFDAQQNRRLISSTDGGANWQFADGAFLTQGKGVCSFAAPSSGSTLFALAQSGHCTQPVGYLARSIPQAQGPEMLWRSDDAGAHWAQVGAFPFAQPDAQNFTAINTRGQAQPTLYTAAGQGNAYTRLFSADGGKTWQPIPTQGISSGAPDSTPLSDGSILALVKEKQGNAFSISAWKPGDQAWHQVTPAIAGDAYNITVSSAGGRDTIWLTTDVNYTSFTVYHYTLP